MTAYLTTEINGIYESSSAIRDAALFCFGYRKRLVVRAYNSRRRTRDVSFPLPPYFFIISRTSPVVFIEQNFGPHMLQ